MPTTFIFFLCTSMQKARTCEIEDCCKNFWSYLQGLQTLAVSLGSKHLLLKSDNLQYNTLVCWFAGTNDSSTKCPIFQVLYFFFHNFSKNSLQKLFQLTFSFFDKFTKMKVKSLRNYKKNNA